MEITYEIASIVLRYDPDTGHLFWLKRDREFFSSDQAMNAWNARFSGERAFVSLASRGYFQGSILGQKLYAHRVAWLLAHRDWPKSNVDHINGDPTDNRLSNLRDVTQAVNLRNSRMPITNTSGVIGVHLSKRDNKWQAQIRLRGKNKHLGYFEKLEDAAAARKSAEQIHGFHQNHGRQI